jgi:hypothetical protein
MNIRLQKKRPLLSRNGRFSLWLCNEKVSVILPEALGYFRHAKEL